MRLTLFVHWDKDNIIDDYVVHYLEQLSQFTDDILFISNSDINENEQNKIKSIVKWIYKRENIGYDFMAWADGFQFLGYDTILKYDEVIMANDSCYAPLFDFKELFDKINQSDFDLVGITDNYELDYHLQSFFIIFKKKVILSDVFQKFWADIDIKESKYQLINDYEVGLTQALLKEGFKIEAIYRTSKWKQILSTIFVFPKLLRLVYTNYQKSKKASNETEKKVNLINKYSKSKLFAIRGVSPVIVYWKELFDNRNPFLKIQLLRENPLRDKNIKHWEEFFQDKTHYQLNLIKKHLDRYKL